MKKQIFKRIVLILIIAILLFNQTPFYLFGYADTEKKDVANNSTNIDNTSSISNTTNATNTISITNITNLNDTNNKNEIKSSNPQNGDVATIAEPRAKGDLQDILDSVVLQDMDGNQVHTINPNNKYTLILDFLEKPGAQMEPNEDGTITYKLPETFKLEGMVVEAALFNENGVEVGTYSIDETGTITIKFNKVDENGNPIDVYFPEYCTDADFKISLTGKFNITETTEDKFVQDFGNGKKLELPIDKEFFIDIEKTNDWGENIYTSGYIQDAHEVYYSVKVSPKTNVENLYVEDILDEKLDFQGVKINKDDPWRALTINYTFPDGTQKQTIISLYQYPDLIFFKEDALLPNAVEQNFNEEKLKKYLEFTKQEDGTTKIKFHFFGKDGSAEIPANTEIKINYYTTLNDLAEKEIRESGNNYDFTVNNKATVTGTAVDSKKELTDSTEIDTPIRGTILNKYGETTTIETQAGGKEVVKWIIDLGDGGTSLNGVKLIDESLTEGMKILEQGFVLKLYRNHDGLPDLDVNYSDLEIKTPFEYTIVGNYGRCHIEFYALYDFQNTDNSTVYQEVKNRVIAEGEKIGKKETTASASVGSDIPISKKEMEPFKPGDTELKFKVHHSIPKSFFEIPDNDLWSAMDHMECLWGESIFYKGKERDVQYKVNWYGLKDYLAQNTKIYISDESDNTFTRREIMYASTWEEYLKEDRFLVNIAEERENGCWMAYQFSKFSGEIPDMLGIDIEYTVPLGIDVDVFESSTGNLLFTGKLEDYTGITFSNKANIEYYSSDYSVYEWFPSGIVDFSLPSKLKKSVNFDYNDEGEIVSNIAKFDVIINEDAKDLLPESKYVKLKDTLCPNLLLMTETIKLYEYNPETDKYDIEITDFKVTYNETEETENNILEIEIPDSKNLQLFYTTRIKKTTDENAPAIQNNVELEGVPSSKSKTEFVFEILDNSAYMGGSSSGKDILLIKYGKSKLGLDKKLLSEVRFELFNAPDTGEKGLLATLTTDDDGTIELKGLDVGKYELVERRSANGYNLLNKPIQIEVKDDGDIVVSENRLVEFHVDENEKNILEVTNIESLKLPLTGGRGQVTCALIGTILILYAIKLRNEKILVKNKKRSSRKGKNVSKVIIRNKENKKLIKRRRF